MYIGTCTGLIMNKKPRLDQPVKCVTFFYVRLKLKGRFPYSKTAQ